MQDYVSCFCGVYGIILRALCSDMAVNRSHPLEKVHGGEESVEDTYRLAYRGS